ncbi:PREDICTED: DNA ligase 3 isoform X3 [Rhagoletis zephyria]|nr:PREDICTED: DNA ligase 3 isoform X3 [Rhagoletis zephyria]XP_017483609.1 PREDICTED: DNA ligase 3 isoform X3 [Rhagoletis zephyria]
MFKNQDNRLDTFRRVCDEIGEERSYNNKAELLKEFFQKGADRKGFKGDVLLWVQMLIPGASHRVYNLQNKQMVKLFSRIFSSDIQDMQRDLEQDGDVSEILSKYFETSHKIKPQEESSLYLQEVEEFLIKLEQRTKEDEQTDLLRQLCKQATALDLRMVIRLIKQDLRINAGARHILDAFGPLAYPAYQSSRDLAAVVKQFASTGKQKQLVSSPLKVTKVTGKIGQVQVMTPISPMLANACKSVEEAFKKCPSGLYTEIKYDGERVQIHKRGNEFKFFSRNLKPVMDHKIKRFHELIPKAFPGGGDMILDSEIILVDTETGSLLPFGTLGAHKKKEFAHAEVCIFTFDCLLYKGEDLTNTPFHKRRKILEEHIEPIKYCVELSESKFLKTKNELSIMTAKVLKANLEGVVLKNPNGIYQPGKRGWLKVKKDYLFGGKMADSADLVVLGAWYGSGKKGGILSIFLMGCYDSTDRLWKTVTKVHSGLDDSENERVHEELMTLMERADPNRVPSWLLCKRALVPDYIAKIPNKMPVWEITGAEFTKSEAHTAAGISIRFPRITRLRADKSADHANDLKYLQKLYDASKKDVNVDLLLSNCDDEDGGGKPKIEEIESKINLTPKKKSKSGNDDDDIPGSSGNMKRKSIEMEKEFCNSSKKRKTQSPNMNGEKSKTIVKVEGKQTKLDFSSHVKGENKFSDFLKKESPAGDCSTDLPKKSDIFKNLIAYFEDKIKDDKLKSSFVSNGGVVTENSQNANIAFYSTTKLDKDLGEIRNCYKNGTRHLSVDWLCDSLREGECKDYPIYAVVLLFMAYFIKQHPCT